MTRHLIHIGYPKTGSTYLRQWFEAHPDIAYAELGIAGFSRINELAAEAVEGHAPEKWRVTSCVDFTQPVPQQDDASPSAQPASAEQPSHICATLASLFPNASILIVTRGFRSMILSGYSQYVRTGGAGELEELIANLSEGPLWDYAFPVELYKSHFGAENVVALPYELLRDDPATFLEVLAQRLGIGTIPFNPARVNVSLSPIELRWYPRLARVILALPVGNSLRRAFFRHYAAAALYKRFGGLVRILQMLRPAKPVTADAIPPRFLATFAGNARCFRADPLYQPYAADYLL
jgi:sulfotransferase family protein